MAIRGLFKRMLSIVLGLALGLLIAEAAVRLFYRGPLIMGYFTTYRDDVGQCLLPNSWGRMRNLPDWDYEFSINAQGFRGDPFLPRALRTPTIAFLGDSYIFGYGVAKHQTIPDQFKVLMQQQYGQSVAAWNCGVWGYTITDTLLSWEKQVEPLDPDIMIYMIYLGNDIEEFARDTRRFSVKHQQGKWHLQVKGAAPDYTTWRHAIEAVPPTARNVVVNNVQLWGLLRPVLRRYYVARQEKDSAASIMASAPPAASVPGQSPSAPEARRVQGLTGRSPDLAETKDDLTSRYVRHVGYLEQLVARPFLVVVVPPHPLSSLKPTHQEHQELEHQIVQQLITSGLKVLDLRETLRPKPYFFKHDGHLTPLGNQVAAQAITSYFTTVWIPNIPVNH